MGDFCSHLRPRRWLLLHLRRHSNYGTQFAPAFPHNLKNRVIAYSSRIISNSLVKGDRKYNYPTVISIILANFEIPELKGSSDFVQHVMLKDDKKRVSWSTRTYRTQWNITTGWEKLKALTTVLKRE